MDARAVIREYHTEVPMGKDTEWGTITSWDFQPGPHFTKWLIREAGYKRMRDALKPGCGCPFCSQTLAFGGKT